MENNTDNSLQVKVKFLIIRLSSIGDIVLTTPVVRCLKQQVEGAEVHFLTKRQFVPVIMANPHIDLVHSFESISETLKLIRKIDIHYIIDLHNNLRTALIKPRSSAISFSFNKLNIEKWLLVNFGIDRMPDMHIVDRYIKPLEVFDVVNDGRGLDYFIPPGDELAMADLPETFRNGYVLFAIGAHHATKRLPTEKITGICKETALPVILAGSREDGHEGEIIARECGDLVLNACGKYNINQSASLVRQARVVISHDTALMHIAAAFKKNIISVWGNTIPEFGMYPYLPGPGSVMFGVSGLKCRPCSKLGFKKCPKKHFRCMRDHNGKGIARLAGKLFAGN